jgi:CDP-diacylglycerol--glycerol-3-phosphate 3-phosphatidyltransferase
VTLKSLPNLLTGLRIVLAVAVFAALLWAAGSDEDGRGVVLWLALAAWIVGALTDYFDGWLARKLDAMSPWGAILDPIADKIAVGGAVVGLVALDPQGGVALPGGLILFRELFVSGLREAGAARGLKFPVTKLAKWKTTLQLVALGVLIAAAAGAASGLAFDGWIAILPLALLWLAAAITLWTGWEYASAAQKGLR